MSETNIIGITPMTVHNRLGILIANKRTKEKRNITLKEISASTNITTRTLQSWLNDDVTRYDARAIEALCGYFQCGIEELIEVIPGKGDKTE